MHSGQRFRILRYGLVDRDVTSVKMSKLFIFLLLLLASCHQAMSGGRHKQVKADCENLQEPARTSIAEMNEEPTFLEAAETLKAWEDASTDRERKIRKQGRLYDRLSMWYLSSDVAIERHITSMKPVCWERALTDNSPEACALKRQFDCSILAHIKLLRCALIFQRMKSLSDRAKVLVEAINAYGNLLGFPPFAHSEDSIDGMTYQGLEESVIEYWISEIMAFRTSLKSANDALMSRAPFGKIARRLTEAGIDSNRNALNLPNEQALTRYCENVGGTNLFTLIYFHEALADWYSLKAKYFEQRQIRRGKFSESSKAAEFEQLSMSNKERVREYTDKLLEQGYNNWNRLGWHQYVIFRLDLENQEQAAAEWRIMSESQPSVYESDVVHQLPKAPSHGIIDCGESSASVAGRYYPNGISDNVRLVRGAAASLNPRQNDASGRTLA
ncbi:hypothetical protein SeMB42_g02594 [Synchytrium endobioticum]|uniref:Uncharacterized protein n=1 Tax=Synchytrium endobioticum TaxID=286115 RepID=A0A507CNU9_9FUNG|nr:hypothetical protein SeLEV6574_g06392 [Synchytrium endobioticum]TPX49484.1 hypothetical protein SeMB42_g02594 [Synchytrium endobioticum]